MNNTNESYRIRTNVGDSDGRLNIDLPLTQTYDTFDILSLKLNQKNQYKYFDSNYGLVVGRVLANNGFGIPNAKISIFIEFEESATDSIKKQLMYRYTSAMDTNLGPEQEQTISISGGEANIRYNLLPDFVDNECHQDVGTFPNKRLVLDNNDVIEVFEKYYKYTTTSNESGDYMIYGVPTGSQTLHVDIDLSDIGILSQRPRDLIYQGYPANLFDSPNKFKSGTDLNSLSQIYSQNKGITVYPYWGNSNNEGDNASNIAITRCDIKIEYEFKPTAIFLGCMVTDRGANAIGKNCTGTDTLGQMAELSAGEGDIEMIRKTLDNKVEQYRIKGDRLIDGDGVWCYQIPMNLDYVMTDEFGNMVQTDDPSKGIPTRARVRFRFTLAETVDDATARKRCKYLVPNNPRMDKEMYPNFYKTHEADYEFGSATQDESYCDLLWNNVYTVKNYIPRLQKNDKITNRKHTGIKKINYSGDNLEMPYNSLSIKLSFVYKLICVLVKTIIYFIAMLNLLLGTLLTPFCGLCTIFRGFSKIPLIGFIFKPLRNAVCALVFECIKLGSDFCDDGIRKVDYYPGCWGCQWKETLRKHKEKYGKITNPEEHVEADNPKFTKIEDSSLLTCVENNLAQENEAVSFNFQNDWVNGVLYAPLWYRKIKKKRSIFFGLIKLKAKDDWCRSDRGYNLRLFQACSLEKDKSEKIISPITGKQHNIPKTVTSNCGNKCHKSVKTTDSLEGGLILTRQNKNDNTIYYYKAIEYNSSLKRKKSGDGVILLFATDIVLLGSLNDCDLNGTPQFYRYLEPTTYNKPSDILFTDTVIQVDSNGEVLVGANDNFVYERFSESTGCDWGNLNSINQGGDECGKQGKDQDGGLFYGIGCRQQEMYPKSCLNLPRICEFGVSLDEAKEIPNLNNLTASNTDSSYERLAPDGFISKDELYNVDERSMFATLNGNKLRTKLNERTGLKEYDLRYLYCNNFDGLMYKFMRHGGDCTYGNNYKLETLCKDYYMFRMGTEPFYYDDKNVMPRYENSFYFYFGLKRGKTAIEKFNGQFFSPCEDITGSASPYTIMSQPNTWCTDMTEKADGYVLIDLTEVSKPCDIIIQSNEIMSFSTEFTNITHDKVYFGTKDFMYDENGNKKEEFIDAYDLNLSAKVYIEDGIYKIPKDKLENEPEPNAIDMIPNGSYTITIVDSEGTIMENTIDLRPQTLSVNIEKETFLIPNNQKLNTYENDIYNRGVIELLAAILKGITNPDAKQYNGYIKIKNVVNGEDSSGTYKLLFNINPNSKYKYFTYLNDNVYSFDIIFKTGEDGFITEILDISNTGIAFGITENNLFSDGDNNALYIPVPEGDVTYQITVIELCDINGKNVESGNRITMNVMVNDTTPFKLYVNDVDVSVLREEVFGHGVGFLGWEVNKELNGDCYTNIGTPNINNLEPKGVYEGLGWLHLSNQDNYVWENLEGYSDLDESVNSTRKRILDEMASIINTCNSIDSDNPDDEIIEIEVEKDNPLFVTMSNYFEAYKNNVDTYDEVISNFKTLLGSVICDEIDIEGETLLFYEFFEEYFEAMAELETFKSEFIQTVKNAFWITCPQNSKDIMIDVKTSFMPIEYYLTYQEEQYSENTNSVGILSNKDTVTCGDKEEGYYVESVLLPTITNVDNTSYGYYGNDNNYKNGTICFGYDREQGLDANGNYVNDYKSYFKKPYTIWVRNGQGEALPYVNGNKDGIQNANPFSFHIIDKGLRFNMLSWGYINNYPYYYYNIEKSGDNIDDYEFKYSNKYSDYEFGLTLIPVNIPGLVCGLFYNGIINSENTFDEISFNSDKKAVGFFTKEGDDEDSIPTRRQIYDKKIYEEDDIKQINYYKNYKVGSIISDSIYTDESEKQHLLYLQVPNRKTNFTIDDGSCVVDNTIYGNMKITLASDSIHNCRDNSATINFNVSNGDENEVNKFMLINSEYCTYPLLGLSYDAEKNAYVFNSGKLKFNKKDDYDYGILDYDMTNDRIISTKNENVCSLWFTGHDSEEDEEGNIITIDNKGWCKSGSFTINDNINNKYFYGVVSTSNNCKVYSPLYSFRPLVLEYKVVRNVTSGEYALKLRFQPDNQCKNSTNFYIRHYGFTLEYGYSGATNASGTLQVENEFFDVDGEINSENELNGRDPGELYLLKTADGKYQLWSTTPSFEPSEPVEVDCDNMIETGEIELKVGEEISLMVTGKVDNDVETIYYNVYKVNKYGELDEIGESGNAVGTLINSTDSYVFVYKEENSVVEVTEENVNEETGETTEETRLAFGTKCFKVNYKYNTYTMLMESDDDPTVRHYQKNYYFVLPENVGQTLSSLLSVPFYRRQAESKINVWVTDASGLKHLCIIKYKQ